MESNIAYLDPECSNRYLEELLIKKLMPVHVYPDNKVHGANMGPTWVLWAPDGLHVGPMNLALRVEFRALTFTNKHIK